MLTNNAIDLLKGTLADTGFLLCDVKSVASLPESVWLTPDPPVESESESPDGVAINPPQGFDSGSLLLVGHAGKHFWEVFCKNTSDDILQMPDPVDCYSAEITQYALEKHLPKIAKQRLFPSEHCPVNLMVLGHAFGWHIPSPLGMGIHAQYGLWSAYRAVWWLDIKLPDDRCSEDAQAAVPQRVQMTSCVNTVDICANCLTQDCVTVCPARAINYHQNPDLGRCADYRLQDNSDCESTCLSRMACPYAAEHRYTEPQMRYHYELARSAIARYRSDSR